MAISSATKNKLNVFHFGAQSDFQEASRTAAKKIPFDLASDDKENAVLENKQENLDSGVNRLPKFSSQRNSPNQRIDVPTTPAGRLALPDLIGMVDVQTVQQDISPDERITWDHTVNAVHSSASSYGAPKRVKKRARSSSPMSSPARASAHFSGRTEALDFHCLNLSLKTPQKDPGNDLWSLYGVNVEEKPLEGPQLPTLAHIMYTSSPQSSREGIFTRSEGSLRKSMGRSNSCGTDWPKRRKLVLAEEQALDDVFAEPFGAVPSKLSLVNTLLGKVQERYGSAVKPERTIDPSRSSPIGGTTYPPRQEESSPILQVSNQVAMPSNAGKSPIDRASFGYVKPADPVSVLKDDSSSSDYGDFDEAFDESMVEVSNTNPALMPVVLPEGVSQSQLLSLNESHIDFSPDMEATLDSASKNNGDDEYGDMGEDVCAEDLENMVARYDVGFPVDHAISSESVEAGKEIDNQASNTQAQIKAFGDDSEDEFGDGFSDVDFEAAEMAATQSLQQPANSSIAVRIRFL